MARDSVVELRRADGGMVEALVSASAFLRADDPVALVALHEVAEQLWRHGTIADTGA